MHHPSKGLDYHHRRPWLVVGPDDGAALCVEISAPGLAAITQISRVHGDFTQFCKQIAMSGVCFQLLAGKGKRSDNCTQIK
jgi:hypothetical protein